jgi:hypothetical protein
MYGDLKLRRCWNRQQAQSCSAAAGTGNKLSQAPPLLELATSIVKLHRCWNWKMLLLL